MKKLYAISNQSSSKQIARIPIGNAPETTGVDRDTNTMYIANHIDNTVSVIRFNCDITLQQQQSSIFQLSRKLKQIQQTTRNT